MSDYIILPVHNIAAGKPLTMMFRITAIWLFALFRLSRCARVSRSRSFFRYTGLVRCSRRACVFRTRSAKRYSGSARLNLCNSFRLFRLRSRDSSFCWSDNRGGAIHHRCEWSLCDLFFLLFFFSLFSSSSSTSFKMKQRTRTRTERLVSFNHKL